MKKVLGALAATLISVGTAQAHVVEGQACWVTGGGKVQLPNGDIVTFGLNGVNPNQKEEPPGLVSGHVTAVNHDTQTAYFCDIIRLFCECELNPAGRPTGNGVAALQGALIELGPGELPPGTTCDVTVYDNGEPGRDDIIAFDSFAGALTFITGDAPLSLGGNIQIHGCLGPGTGH